MKFIFKIFNKTVNSSLRSKYVSVCSCDTVSVKVLIHAAHLEVEQVRLV